jgi:FtsP/CotA-like multicopper oxidase with cupredoxin domain
MQHHTIGVPTLSARRSPAIGSRVCAKLDDQEIWELVNNTNELQNFHIH